MRWEPGSPIILRSIREQRVGHVRTHTVVEDRDELVALYLAPGYPCKRPAGTRGGPRGRVLLTDTGQHEDWVWGRHRVLILYRSGDAHTVQLFWRAEDGAFSGWYIDLHEPLRRTPLGFDTRDYILDVVVAPDRSSWLWKDEDELAWHVAAGTRLLPPPEMLRAEGTRAIERLTATTPHLYQEWESWSPDPAWPIPTMPANWQTLFSPGARPFSDESTH